MRVAAEAACAVRPIAQNSWRVVMALQTPSVSTAKFAEQGKVRVNRISDGVLSSGRPLRESSAAIGQQRCPFSKRSVMDERQRTLFRRAWPRQAVFTLLYAALLFRTAGTLEYWQGWLFLVAFVGSSIALGFYFVKHDPALVERRMTAGPAAETEPAQKIIIALIMVGFLLLSILPALDYRWHWSTVPAWLAILANIGIVASFVIFFWVMKQNSYAAATVRVEAGQPIISTGLYGVVRHPMYSGALLLMICMPPALGSYWGFLLLIPLVVVLAWRLLDEERVLARDLPGYADYCRQVRYRLIPYVW